jgi:hypothetical protein
MGGTYRSAACHRNEEVVVDGAAVAAELLRLNNAS